MNRTALTAHSSCSEFELLLKFAWPILSQSIQRFTGFVPFGVGLENKTPHFYQWPITEVLPNFGLEAWVKQQIKNQAPALNVALLAQQVSINRVLHVALYLDSTSGPPLLIFVPFEPTERENWWSEPSVLSLL